MLVAEKMNEIASQEKISFIIGTGDNFYNPDGVTSVNDNNWNTHWADIYPIKKHLKGLPWFGVLGNHDYNNTGL